MNMSWQHDESEFSCPSGRALSYVFALKRYQEANNYAYLEGKRSAPRLITPQRYKVLAKQNPDVRKWLNYCSGAGITLSYLSTHPLGPGRL